MQHPGPVACPRRACKPALPSLRRSVHDGVGAGGGKRRGEEKQGEEEEEARREGKGRQGGEEETNGSQEQDKHKHAKRDGAPSPCRSLMAARESSSYSKRDIFQARTGAKGESEARRHRMAGAKLL